MKDTGLLYRTKYIQNCVKVGLPEEQEWINKVIDELVIEIEGLECLEEALKSQMYNKEANC